MARRHIKNGQVCRRLILAFFITIGAFLLAHAVNGVVAYSLVQPEDQFYTVKPAVQSELDAHASRRTRQVLVQEILSRGLFPLPSAPKEATAQGSATAPSAPPLNVSTKVSLIGVVKGVPGNERAIIEDLSSKKQGLYRVSQRIQDVGELAAIEKERVLFREGGQEEWLELAIVKQLATMPPFPQISHLMPPGTPVRVMSWGSPARRTLDRAYVVQATAKPEVYMTEARLYPHFSGRGQTDGLQMDSLRPYGLLERTGFQNGDVLSTINGVDIRDPVRLWEIFKQLQQERSVQFNVFRQGQPLIVALDIRG